MLLQDSNQLGQPQDDVNVQKLVVESWEFLMCTMFYIGLAISS